MIKSFFRSMRAVAWSFLGIRSNKSYAQDVSQLNPFHIIVAGVLMTFVFVAVLVIVVHYMIQG